MKNEPKKLHDLFSTLRGEKLKGSVEFVLEPKEEDLMEVFRKLAASHKSEFVKLLNNYSVQKYGVAPVRLDTTPDLSRVAIILRTEVDTGAMPVAGKVHRAAQRSETKGSAHVWKGFYEAVGAILDEQRGRDKTFISYDDLLAELHDFTDEKGNKMFEKNGDLLPMKILRHRMAPSQVVRQAKGQPNLRGVENDKKNKGLKFY